MKRNRNDDVIHFPSRNTCYRQNQYINNNSKFNINNEFYSRNNFEYYDEKTNIFDEFDKANPTFHNAFYEMFDEGIFRDINYKVNVENSIIICTSNYQSLTDIIKNLGPATACHDSWQGYLRPCTD